MFSSKYLKPSRSAAAISSIALILSAVSQMSAAANPVTTPQTGSTPGLVVKYAPGVVAPLSADAAVPGSDSAGVKLTPGAPVGLGWYEVDFTEPVDQQTAQQIAERLTNDPAVEYAEQQLIVSPATATPNATPAARPAASAPTLAAAIPAPSDPLWLQQWGFASYGDDAFTYPGVAPAGDLDRQTTGTNLLEALGAQRGKVPTVAVIDTGIAPHPDLKARATSGYNFISDPARAGNNFGRGPDYTDLGDWVSQEQASSLPFSLIGCAAPTPSSWHGTHVSGTIAALIGNKIGVAGTAPAPIQTLRALGRCGGSSGDIAAAILWAAGGSVPGVPDNTKPARVINMSLGSIGLCPQHVQDAIDFANSRGTVVVTAAGNLSTNAFFFAPGNCADVINVAASDPYGGRAPFSNFGTYVDVAAPGSGIMSTLDSGLTGPQGPAYGAYDGTSMAAPHVSGAVALMLGAEPFLTPQQVRDRVSRTATPFKQSTSFSHPGVSTQNPAFDCVGDDSCGAGYLNTAALLGQATAAAPVTTPRYQARASGGSATLRIAFEPPPTGADSYGYSVARGTTVVAEGTTTTTAATVTVPGPASDAFTVLITPILGGRPGVAAAAMRVPSVSGSVPAPPTIESVEPLGDAAFVVVNNTYATPGLTSTTVTAQPGDLTCELATNPDLPTYTDSPTSCVVYGLTPGQEYTFTASAGNALGMSRPSAAVKVTPTSGPAVPPTKPKVLSVAVQGNTATVQWSPSLAASGRQVVAYSVRALGASEEQLAQCVVVGTGAAPLTNSCQVPNLFDGETYRFVVAATDDSFATSESAPSPPVQVSMAAVPPSAPLDPPYVVLDDGMATVGLSGPPLFNGGSRILGVRFDALPGGGSCDIPWSADVFDASCNIEGLDNSAQYVFTATAFNAIGLGNPSDPTAPLTPGPPTDMGELHVLPQATRVLDTRSGSPLQPGKPRVVNVRAPAGALAVAYNLTITGTTGSGYASVFPNGAAVPATSVTNWSRASQTVANAHVSALGPDRRVSLLVAGTRAHAVVDVTGFYMPLSAPLSEPSKPPGGRLVPIPPARAYDSRVVGGVLAGGTSRTVDVSGLVPSGAQAVAYTLTETGTSKSGFLSVGLPGEARPGTSVLNWSGPNQTAANTATAALDPQRRFEVFAGGTGSTHVVVDVIGYFAPADVNPDGLMFAPVNPSRVYDSRVDTPPGPVSSNRNITTSMAGAGVPPAAGAVAVNLTATGTKASGWLALMPGGSFAPSGVSTLNWMQPNTTVANGTIIGTSSNNVTTYAGGGSAQYLLDVAGYYIRPRF